MSDKFFSNAALAAAGVTAAGLLSARVAQAASTPTTHVTFYFTAPPPGAAAGDPNVIQVPNTSTNFASPSLDVQIVNFALAVETIEAERYRQSIIRLTTGTTSPSTTDMFGNAINGLGRTTADLDVLLVTGFAQTEMQQRDILSTTLYGSPAANPFLDTTKFLFDYGINALDRTATVANVCAAENVGVAAYLGGSGLLKIQSPFLAPAASFLGVEARHAAGLAYALNSLGVGPVFQTAPLNTDQNSLGINGGDMPLSADMVLYAGGKIASGLLPNTAGAIPVQSGPAGFVYRPNA